MFYTFKIPFGTRNGFYGGYSTIWQQKLEEGSYQRSSSYWFVVLRLTKRIWIWLSPAKELTRCIVIRNQCQEHAG